MSIGTQNFEMAAENYYNIIHLQRKYIQYNSNQSCKWFRNWNQIPESESESKPGLLESELESESNDAGIGIRIGIKRLGTHWNQNQNRNHLLLESELESESLISFNPGVGIRSGISSSGIGIGIGIIKKLQFWNQIGMRITCHILSGVIHWSHWFCTIIVIRKKLLKASYFVLK